MPFLIQYLLKLSISLAAVFLFYQLFLRRLTFHNWNRYYLLGYSLLSFFIPFINIAPFVENKNIAHVQVIHYIPVINNYISAPSNTVTVVPSALFNYWGILLFIIFLGSFIMLIRFFVHFYSLQKIKRNAAIINAGEAAVYQVNENIIPFSFGNAIYINQQLHTEKEFEEIILHEYVHVKQNHTADILFGELLCVINWFNPFAWLIRRSIRQNLEFIADDFVLKNGLDKKAYQYHLLKVVGTPQYRIANSFNFSSLKKRIAMMNKLKSAKLHLVKFLFVLPLIAFLLLAFRDKYNKNILKNNHGANVNLNEGHPGKLSETVVPAADDLSKNKTPILFSDRLKDTIPSKADSSSILPGKSVIQGKSLEEVLRDADLFSSQPGLGPVNVAIKSKKALYVIDGVEIPRLLDWGELINPSAIKSMTVLKDSDAISKYGTKGQYGVIEIAIFTKNATVAEAAKNKFDSALFIVDGKQIDRSALSNLNPALIDSITILKDSIAFKQYGEKGKNGAVIIKTKNPKSLNLQNPKSQSTRSDTSYIDDVNVQNGMMNWQINKDYPKHPLYLVNGKIVGKDPKQININSADMHIAEFLGKGAKLKQYGKEGEDGVINFVTKSEKDNKAAYIFPREVSVDSTLIKEFIKEAAITNKLYVGIENPLKISAEDISDKDIVVQMDNKFGQIKKRNGLYYILAKLPGNAEIKIYQKGKEGSLKLLNSRYFRVEYLPDPVSVVRFNNS